MNILQGWRSLSESSPPLDAEVFLYEPEADGAGPFLWMVRIGVGGRVEFCLPPEQWEDYSIEENYNYMADLLKKCTHWGNIWSVVIAPPAHAVADVAREGASSGCGGERGGEGGA